MNHRIHRWTIVALAVLTIVFLATDISAQKAAKKKSVAKKQSSAAMTAKPAAKPGTPATGTDTVARTQQTQAADTVRKPSSPPPFEYRTVQNNAFGVGERLTFDVSYGFITAGEAVMAVTGYSDIMGRKCFRIEFTVNSLPSFSWIYKVEDRYLTFIDLQSIAPLRFEQHIREGSYSRDFSADFDQANHIARTTEGEHPIPPYVHDIMSAFYYVRTLDFSNAKTGDIFTLHNFYKDTTYDLGVKILGRQELEVEAGTFNTIVVEPLVKEGGLFKSEGRIVIWLTDDDLKVPIRVNTKVVIGSIDTELREYSGLRGPVRARTK